jgi:hypothetical protein
MNDGVLCNVLWITDSVRGKNGKLDEVPRDPARMPGFSTTPSFITGVVGMTDGEICHVKVVPDGIYKYTTVLGSEATVKKYRILPKKP